MGAIYGSITPAAVPTGAPQAAACTYSITRRTLQGQPAHAVLVAILFRPKRHDCVVFAQVPWNPRLRDSPRIDIVAPLKGINTFVAPNAKVGEAGPAASVNSSSSSDRSLAPPLA
jgi:hypothetical protein